MTVFSDREIRPDPRFFSTSPPLDKGAVLDLLAGDIAEEGGGRAVTHVAPAGQAGTGAAIFLESWRGDHQEAPVASEIALVLVRPSDAEAVRTAFPGALILAVPGPKASFARLAHHLHRSLAEQGGWGMAEADIDPHAVVHDTAILGDGARIGAGAVIGPYALIGPGCEIGEDTQVGPHSVITHAIIGKRCRFLSGTRVGEPGFGYIAVDGRPVAVPQLGRVMIGDEVDVGANTTIDRGALDDTRIGSMTKIDNLCQIAHNCRFGKGVVVASQTGVSGSCTIGDGAMIGGQAGMADHLTIGAGAMISAKSGLMKDVPPGERWGGIPAKPARQWMKEVASLSRLAKGREK
ncbi:UDP-3-O-(3-hydroxymyristoyl)glucosamine N-acyltransferase [Parvularcula bermudensis]|uniref:UDP-3-O-(3-hydroxymyristoyl)glucosamine N-acyltransferase n=1 Tax=Parvularcula bermudensis TaxID=208216 RepID=UPI000067ED94|nr:UDP-3-O-(3-hydroxymyristoyl)glucosamine N-acyltransferase [Parvularcula bermudensis]